MSDAQPPAQADTSRPISAIPNGQESGSGTVKSSAANTAPSSANPARVLSTNGANSNTPQPPTTASAPVAADGAAAAQPAESEFQGNAVIYQNTYRTKPEKKFQSGAIERILDQLLQKNLYKVKYDGATALPLAQQISSQALAAVKQLNYERYKFVCDVTIGEFKGQGIRVSSRSLWDTTTDSYAYASFRNATIFAIAKVFGVYYE